MGSTDSIANPVIFFDGVCNLCNSSVQFVIKRDKRKTFRFASLQSNASKEALPQELTEGLQSLVLLDEGKTYSKSTAALLISRRLSGVWPALSIFLIIPKFVRDGLYDFVAKNRYKWFGKSDSCMIPTPEMKSRFID